MENLDRRLDALAYSLGWVMVLTWAWVMAAWGEYLAWLAGWFRFLPDAWWPSREVHLIFIGVAKLAAVGLLMWWVGVVLYRCRLRRP